MSGTRIIQCTCKDEFQDNLYGTNMRLHNMSHDNKTAYCTVCSPNNTLRKITVPAPPKKGKVLKV